MERNVLYNERDIPENLQEQTEYWQYRLVKRPIPDGILMSIHEVYFDRNDRPLLMTEYPVEVLPHLRE